MHACVCVQCNHGTTLPCKAMQPAGMVWMLYTMRACLLCCKANSRSMGAELEPGLQNFAWPAFDQASIVRVTCFNHGKTSAKLYIFRHFLLPPTSLCKYIQPFHCSFAIAQGILFIAIFYVVMPISSKKVAMPPGSLSGVLARKSHRSRLPESMLTARALGLSFITAHGNANCGLKLYPGELGCSSQRQKCLAVSEAGNTKCQAQTGRHIQIL